MSSSPTVDPPTEPQENKPSPNEPETVVSLRDRLLQSNKARTQGGGSGQDREDTSDMKRRRNVVWLILTGGLEVPVSRAIAARLRDRLL